MSSPDSPTQTRSYIVERLIGASGAADEVVGVARGQAERAMPTLAKTINDALTSQVEIAIVDVDIGRQGDMTGIAGDNGALTVVASATSGDALVMSIDAAAIGVIVNALFGGEPDTSTEIDRPLSAIELDVAAIAFEKAAAAFNGTGARSLNLKFPLAPPVTGDDLVKKTLRDGPSVRVHYSIFTGSGSGKLVMSMPHRVLLQHRGAKARAGEETAALDWSERFSSQVIRSAVNMEATVPLARMTLQEVALLEEGQVIELPINAQSQTKLGTPGRPLFVGDFGKLGQHYTIRINHPFDAGQELMEDLLPS